MRKFIFQWNKKPSFKRLSIMMMMMINPGRETEKMPDDGRIKREKKKKRASEKKEKNGEEEEEGFWLDPPLEENQPSQVGVERSVVVVHIDLLRSWLPQAQNPPPPQPSWAPFTPIRTRCVRIPGRPGWMQSHYDYVCAILYLAWPMPKPLSAISEISFYLCVVASKK